MLLKKLSKNFISKSADISKNEKIGKNCKIWNNAQIREKVVIGNNVFSKTVI